jgi:hypothetical protein
MAMVELEHDRNVAADHPPVEGARPAYLLLAAAIAQCHLHLVVAVEVGGAYRGVCDSSRPGGSGRARSIHPSVPTTAMIVFQPQPVADPPDTCPRLLARAASTEARSHGVEYAISTRTSHHLRNRGSTNRHLGGWPPVAACERPQIRPFLQARVTAPTPAAPRMLHGPDAASRSEARPPAQCVPAASPSWELRRTSPLPGASAARRQEDK